MGTGVSKMGGGGDTAVSSKDGFVIDLSKTPLKYGEKDPALSKTQREYLEKYERGIVKEPLEHLCLIDKDVNPTIPGGEAIGTATNVDAPPECWAAASVGTHNHTRNNTTEAGRIGGTFSSQDLKYALVERGLDTFRASTAEGTYSITKTPKFKAEKAVEYFDSNYGKGLKKYEAKRKKIESALENGKIDLDTSIKRKAKAFNEWAVSFHNTLLKGQKKYGYNYTLERKD